MPDILQRDKTITVGNTFKASASAAISSQFSTFRSILEMHHIHLTNKSLENPPEKYIIPNVIQDALILILHTESMKIGIQGVFL